MVCVRAARACLCACVCMPLPYCMCVCVCVYYCVRCVCVCARARVSVCEHLCTCLYVSVWSVCVSVRLCLCTSVCPPDGTRRAMYEPYFLRTGQARLSQVKVAFSTRMASPAHDKAQYRWAANTVVSDTDHIRTGTGCTHQSVLTAPISC